MGRLVFILCVLFASTILVAQSSSRDEYEWLLSEANLFLRYNDSVHLDSALIDSARFYAADESFELAVVFLEQYLSNQRANQPAPPQIDSQPASPQFNLKVRGGIDFNRQEFELGYLESDSLILDEVNKPFTELETEILLWEDKNGKAELEGTFRFDKENTTGALKAGGDFKIQDLSGGINASWQTDKNQLYPDYSYTQWASHQSLEWTPGSGWKARLSNDIRMKAYQKPSVNVPDFLNNVFQGMVQFLPGPNMLLALDYLNTINESQNTRNNDYKQYSLNLTGNYHSSGGVNVDVGVGFEHNNFVYTLSDSLLENVSAAFLSEFQGTMPLNNWLNFQTKNSFRLKEFSRKSEEEPDYFFLNSSNQLRFALTPHFTVGGGYSYEIKKHKHFSGAINAYIDEQNYYSNGIVLGADYMRLAGFFLSFEGTYSRRRFPEASVENWSGLYANRNVLNLNLILQLPVTEKLHFGTYLSYDNDRDIDSDSGNTRSMVFSSTLEYNF